MHVYPGADVPRKYWEEDPATWPATVRELDEIGPVFKIQPYESDHKRWGVAVPHDERPGCFRVVRHADRDHAERISTGADWVTVAWTHSGRRGVGRVEPLVASTDSESWVFTATGWDVPL